VSSDLVRRLYETIAAADIPGFTAVLAPDVEWRVPGSHDLAGTSKGIAALLTHLAEVARRTGGQVNVHIDEIITGERHTVALVDVDMSVDGQTVHDSQVHVFEVRDDRITSVREYHGDERAFDELFK
jgi:ketosteroid isomerase-like protein